MNASQTLMAVAESLQTALEGLHSLAAAVQEQKADIPVEDIHTSVQDISSLISQYTAQGRTVPFKFLSQTLSPGNYERRDYQKCYQAYIKIFPHIAHINAAIPEKSPFSSRLNLKQALKFIAEIPEDSEAYQDALSSAIDEIEQIETNSKGEKYEQNVNPACNFIYRKLKKMLDLVRKFNEPAQVPQSEPAHVPELDLKPKCEPESEPEHVPEFDPKLEPEHVPEEEEAEEKIEEEEEEEEGGYIITRDELIRQTLEGLNIQIQEISDVLSYVPHILQPPENAGPDYVVLFEIFDSSLGDISYSINRLKEIRDEIEDFIQCVSAWD